MNCPSCQAALPEGPAPVTSPSRGARPALQVATPGRRESRCRTHRRDAHLRIAADAAASALTVDDGVAMRVSVRPGPVARSPPAGLQCRSMESLAERLRAAVATRSGVRLVYLFGSAARGRLRPGSDVDVAVRFSHRQSIEDLCELAEDLERAARHRVDLVDLDDAPPLLLREVVKEGRLVWAADDDERVTFELRALARYMDTAHLRRVQRDYLHQWAEAYRAGTR